MYNACSFASLENAETFMTRVRWVSHYLTPREHTRLVLYGWSTVSIFDPTFRIDYKVRLPATLLQCASEIIDFGHRLQTSISRLMMPCNSSIQSSVNLWCNYKELYRYRSHEVYLDLDCITNTFTFRYGMDVIASFLTIQHDRIKVTTKLCKNEMMCFIVTCLNCMLAQQDISTKCFASCLHTKQRDPKINSVCYLVISPPRVEDKMFLLSTESGTEQDELLEEDYSTPSPSHLH